MPRLPPVVASRGLVSRNRSGQEGIGTGGRVGTYINAGKRCALFWRVEKREEDRRDKFTGFRNDSVRYEFSVWKRKERLEKGIPMNISRLKSNLVHMLCALALMQGTILAQSTNVNVRTWGTDDLTNVPNALTDAVAISASPDGVSLGNYALALRSNGTVVAWGNPGPSFGCVTNVPGGLSNVIAIAAGLTHCLALKNDGKVVAWGSGPGTNVPPSATNIVAIAAGGSYSLLLKNNGTLIAWGVNMANPPSLTNVIAISAGLFTAVALLGDNTVTSFGDSIGAQDAGLSNVVAISGGAYYNLALISNGTVVGWGTDSAGQIDVPPGLSNVVAIAAGAIHSLALLNNGQVIAWGSGPGTNVPPDLPFATAIAATTNGSLALINPLIGSTGPTILSVYPMSQTLAIGSTGYISVEAAGFPPLTYQWYFGTNAIPGATNSTLVLSGLQPGQAGNYSVTVSNSINGTRSSPVTLSVLPSLGINMVPMITLIGEVGQTYDLEYVNSFGPTNAWVDLATITLTNNPQYYFDVSAIGQPSRFYQLVQDE